MSRYRKNAFNYDFFKFVFLVVFFPLTLLLFFIRFLSSSDKNKKRIKNNSKTLTIKKADSNKYTKKTLMTKNELYFYEILQKNYNDKYIVMPQVNLASIITKNKDFPAQYQNELFRNIDFGLFDKNTMECLLLIEINDNTHNRVDRRQRDDKVKSICEMAGIKLITFYTRHYNYEGYILKCVDNAINE